MMNEKDTRKQVYEKIQAIISDDDNFPSVQADELAKFAQQDGRLFLIFYLLLVAWRVMYWRNRATHHQSKANAIEQNARLLEEINIDF